MNYIPSIIDENGDPVTTRQQAARERWERIAAEIRRKPNQQVRAVAKKFRVSDPTVYAAAREHGVALTSMTKLRAALATPYADAPPTGTSTLSGPYADTVKHLQEERKRLLARVEKIDIVLEVLQSA